MPAPLALIAHWARSAVVPRGGAFNALQAHEIASPVVQALLQGAGLDRAAVDVVVLGNALGAGGNPARMLALHAGLPQRCAAYTLDTQCCAGLDAVATGAALIASGQAQVVIAGGAEAWSRSPMRMHRPLHPGVAPVPYERPAFAPTPEQDPDMLLSAARYAAAHGYTRSEQEAYALNSHARAVASQDLLATEIVPLLGVRHDAYPRLISAERAARMPVVACAENAAPSTFGLSTLTISAQADGAAFVLLMSAQACAKWDVTASMALKAHASVGSAPEIPLIAAELAAREVLKRAGDLKQHELACVELHDAFAVQALSFAKGLGLRPEQLNLHGGGIARGHPIGASAAVALVRLLSDLARHEQPDAKGLVAVAGAGGLGSAGVVQKLWGDLHDQLNFLP
nr:thiolase family protein [Hylemonella gracilis]